MTRYPGSTTAIRALLAGDADVVETGADTALLAMESGAPIDILLSPVARGTDVVVARSSVASLADMKGKRYAVSAPGSPGDVLGRLLLQRQGVDPGQVQFVALGAPADRIKALLGGKVDATSATILVMCRCVSSRGCIIRWAGSGSISISARIFLACWRPANAITQSTAQTVWAQIRW